MLVTIWNNQLKREGDVINNMQGWAGCNFSDWFGHDNLVTFLQHWHRLGQKAQLVSELWDRVRFVGGERQNVRKAQNTFVLNVVTCKCFCQIWGIRTSIEMKGFHNNMTGGPAHVTGHHLVHNDHLFHAWEFWKQPLLYALSTRVWKQVKFCILHGKTLWCCPLTFRHCGLLFALLLNNEFSHFFLWGKIHFFFSIFTSALSVMYLETPRRRNHNPKGTQLPLGLLA